MPQEPETLDGADVQDQAPEPDDEPATDAGARRGRVRALQLPKHPRRETVALAVRE